MYQVGHCLGLRQ